MYVCMYVGICMYASMHVCMYVYVCMYACMYTYVRMDRVCGHVIINAVRTVSTYTWRLDMYKGIHSNDGWLHVSTTNLEVSSLPWARQSRWDETEIRAKSLLSRCTLDPRAFGIPA